MESATRKYDSSVQSHPVRSELTALVEYRELILQFISRSLKTRYKRSALGIAWTMLNPLLTMIVLTLVFSNLFNFSGRDYALYVLSGLILWNFFSQSTIAAANDLMWSGGLIGRIFVPKSAFAVAAIGTGLVNLTLAMVAYSGISLVLGQWPSGTWFLLPIPILLTAAFTLGVGLAISSAAVFFPDVLPMYEVFLTIWFYLTPVIYPVQLLPETIQTILRLNPMFSFIEVYRSLILVGEMPDPNTILIATLSALASLLLGWWVFARRTREYAYRI
jgi:ABC-2 type transport system permease protein